MWLLNVTWEEAGVRIARVCPLSRRSVDCRCRCTFTRAQLLSTPINLVWRFNEATLSRVEWRTGVIIKKIGTDISLSTLSVTGYGRKTESSNRLVKQKTNVEHIAYKNLSYWYCVLIYFLVNTMLSTLFSSD